MDTERWQAIDTWFADRLHTADDVLEQTLATSAEAGLAPISVSRNLGKFLEILAGSIGVTRILEIGTLGGYSTICLARALPTHGKLITLEISPENACVATSNITKAGLSDRIEIRVGDARESLRRMAARADEVFDLVFIDANKDNNPDYFREALRLTRPGAVILVDNVVRHGRVLDSGDAGSDIRGVREMIELISTDPRVSATVIQTVGDKSHDGFLIARVTA